MISGGSDAICAARVARQQLLDELLTHPSGLDWCERQTDWADSIVREVVADVFHAFPVASPISIVATGGYGRRELAPFSDVDLTVIPLQESDPLLDPALRSLFRGLQNTFGQLGLSVGYAYRVISDVPGLDAKTRTGLMDARWLAGSHVPLELMDQLFWDTFPVG